MLSSGAGKGVAPLVIVGVVAALVTTLGLSRGEPAAEACAEPRRDVEVPA